ncbi:MAG TPA: TlpA disulfide reductase family protein, partial [Pirellulales bacterium]|nr:TlpA disulfide reductase family protein [Pirellulales bacterium]
MAVQFTIRIIVVLTLALLSDAAFAADDEENGATSEEKQPFSVALVDEDGKPVEGAAAGVTAHFGAYLRQLAAERELRPLDESGWFYQFGARSGADGVVHFVDGKQYEYQCIVARHAVRRLVGIAKTRSAELKKATAAVTLYPECRVSGRLISTELERHRGILKFPNAVLWMANGAAFGFTSDEGDGAFHFFLPPGEFVVESYGANAHFVKKMITVATGQREMDLGDIDLPATRLALLEGQPAPELSDIAAWKNSSPVKLADLKGKCVILDFWGYWCGPCVDRMPGVFDLYDKYRATGLEIVGVHIDLGA